MKLAIAFVIFGALTAGLGLTLWQMGASCAIVAFIGVTAHHEQAFCMFVRSVGMGIFTTGILVTIGGLVRMVVKRREP